MSEQQIKSLVSEVLNWSYPDISIVPTTITLDVDTTNTWSPSGTEVLFIESVVLTYSDELYFINADDLCLKLRNSIADTKVNFNFGGPTGHHVLNPLLLNFLIDDSVTLFDIAFPAAGNAYATINGYILDLVP